VHPVPNFEYGRLVIRKSCIKSNRICAGKCHKRWVRQSSGVPRGGGLGVQTPHPEILNF
jgi:hypothetical protein